MFNLYLWETAKKTESIRSNIIQEMNEIRKEVDAIDPSLFIYGEGWSAGSCAIPNDQLGMKANIPQMPGIAAFSDEIRDALRGPFNDDTKPAFLAGLADNKESLKFGIVGAICHPQVDMTKVNYSQKPWAIEPTQMISYVSCHDDMCLVDRLKASTPGITTEELIKLDMLAQTAVFTSQGVPFMLSGEELLRNKKGVHNSFESPDSINELPWENLKKYPQVFSYYKNLIQLRKNHPAFRLGNADLVRKHLEFIDTPEGTVAFRLNFQSGLRLNHFFISSSLLRLFDDVDDAPSLILGDRAGLHDANGIADAAAVLFVMRLELAGAVDHLAVKGVTNLGLDGDDYRFFHLIADDDANAGFTITSHNLFHCLSSLLGVLTELAGTENGKHYARRHTQYADR